MILGKLILALLTVPLVLLVFHTSVWFMRQLFKVPMPESMADFISNALYPLARKLVEPAAAVGFRLRTRLGGVFQYTLMFERDL